VVCAKVDQEYSTERVATIATPPAFMSATVSSSSS
jgi:hypothetical protein